MEIPISLVVGVLLLSLGVAVAAVLRTFMNAGRILAIEKIMEPMPEVHRSAAELRATVKAHGKELDELKQHLDKVRLENKEDHRLDRQENSRAHDQIVRLITEHNEHCGTEDD